VILASTFAYTECALNDFTHVLPMFHLKLKLSFIRKVQRVSPSVKADKKLLNPEEN